MLDFFEALEAGFKRIDVSDSVLIVGDSEVMYSESGYYSYVFGDNNEYELCFEPFLANGRKYLVSLYKNKELLIEKIPVMPGFIRQFKKKV